MNEIQRRHRSNASRANETKTPALSLHYHLTTALLLQQPTLRTLPLLRFHALGSVGVLVLVVGYPLLACVPAVNAVATRGEAQGTR